MQLHVWISKAELNWSAQCVCVFNPTLTTAKQSLTEVLDEGVTVSLGINSMSCYYVWIALPTRAVYFR